MLFDADIFATLMADTPATRCHTLSLPLMLLSLAAMPAASFRRHAAIDISLRFRQLIRHYFRYAAAAISFHYAFASYFHVDFRHARLRYAR